MAWQWKLIIQDCTGCGVCADVCPEEAVRIMADMAYPEPVPGKCVGCLTCINECPFDALEVSEIRPAQEHLYQQEPPHL